MSKQRLTLAQMAAQSQQSEGVDPWACRSCGCKDWRVRDSRMNGDVRKRERVCRHCGEPMTTYEAPVPPDHIIMVIPESQ